MPFIFYYMWHWSFLPDQSKYAYRVFQFRNFSNNEGFLNLFFKTNISSLLLAFFPIPFVTTIVSIAIINKGILLMTVFYFINKKQNFFIVPLLIFLPSMNVISSVALRDMITISIGILFVFFFIEEKNYLKTFILGVLFFLTKKELAIICLSTLATYLIIFKKFKLNKINIKSLTVLCLILVCFFNLFNYFENMIKHYRDGFFIEQVEYQYSIYANINLDFLSILKSIFIFWLSPLSTEELNLKNAILFLENIFIFYLLFLLLVRINKENQAKALFWFLVWVMISTIYGTIFINAGTIWRYKLVMQIIFLCMVYFSIKNKKKAHWFTLSK